MHNSKRKLRILLLLCHSFANALTRTSRPTTTTTAYALRALRNRRRSFQYQQYSEKDAFKVAEEKNYRASVPAFHRPNTVAFVDAALPRMSVVASSAIPVRVTHPSSSSVPNPPKHQPQRRNDICLRVLSELDDTLLRRVSHFLVQAYWLGSARLWVETSGRPLVAVTSSSSSSVSTTLPSPPHMNARQMEALLQEQATDLSLKYSRKHRQQSRLQSTLIMATKTAAADTIDSRFNHASSSSSQEAIVGMVCLHELLLDTKRGILLPMDESECVLQRIIDTLPHGAMKRQYETASATRIFQSLVSSQSSTSVSTQHLVPVRVLCNLAVSPEYRRQGIARRLCQQAELCGSQQHLSSQQWRISKRSDSWWETSSASTAAISPLPPPHQYRASPSHSAPKDKQRVQPQQQQQQPMSPLLVLKVEAGNESARQLYDALGYVSWFGVAHHDAAVRLNVQTGELVEIEVDSHLLGKSIPLYP